MITKPKQSRGRIRRRRRRAVTATTPGVDRPQPDPWLALFPPGTAIIAKDENQPGLQIPLLALEDEIDSDFNEIRFVILPDSPSQLWERVAQEVEDFCVGSEFVLQNCVTVSSAPSQIQDSLHQTRVWVSDRSGTSENSTSPRNNGGIFSALQLYEMLKKKRLSERPADRTNIYHSRRIYINHPDGPCILSLIKTAPLSQYQGYRELLANYLTTTPEPRIRVYDSDMWNGCFIILFNLPCLAISYEDRKDTRTIGDRAELRHRFDLSFLTSKNPTEVMRDEKRGKLTPRFLHEVNFSLMVTGKSDTYWTAVCLNEDSFERNPRLDADGDVDMAGLEPNEDIDPITMSPVDASLTPRTYSLQSLANYLDTLVDYQKDIHYQFKECLRCHSLDNAKGPRSYLSLKKAIERTKQPLAILPKVLYTISQMSGELERFLNDEVVFGEDGIPKGRLFQSLRDDQCAIKSLKRLRHSRYELNALERPLKLIMAQFEEIKIELRNEIADAQHERTVKLTQVGMIISVVVLYLGILTVIAQLYGDTVKAVVVGLIIPATGFSGCVMVAMLMEWRIPGFQRIWQWARRKESG